jgi:hypothetical protein
MELSLCTEQVCSAVGDEKTDVLSRREVVSRAR